MQEKEEVKQAIDQVLHIYQREKEQEDGEWGKETQEPTTVKPHLEHIARGPINYPQRNRELYFNIHGGTLPQRALKQLGRACI